MKEGLVKVPLYIDTYVDDQGNVYDGNFNKKQLYENRGYYQISLTNRQNKRRSVLVNRLIAEAFIENDRPDRFMVNHIDGNTLNNKVDNLDWVTPYENNIHGILLNYETHKFKMYISEDGVPVKAVKGLYAAQDYTGIDYKDIWEAIKENKNIGKYSFTYIHKDDNLPVELRTYKENLGLKKKVKILDTTTGVLVVYDSQADAAKALNVYHSAIYQAIYDPDYHNGGSKLPKLIHQRYLVEYAERDFPPWTEEQLRKAKDRGAKEVFVYNTETKERKIYPTAAEFIRENDLPKSVVTKAFHKGKLINVKGWYFTYFYDTPEFKKKEEEIFKLAGHERNYYPNIKKTE